MTDLFQEKAKEWDKNQMVLQLSSAVGSSILDQVELIADMLVMDFGAGTGLVTSHIAPHVNEIVAVDVSAAMLEKLAAKPELQGKVTTVCQDITECPLDQKFDLIVSAMAMHHVKDTGNLFKQFAAHLKTGGSIALADLDKEDGTFHPEDIEGVFHHGFNRDELRQVIENSGFSDVQFVTAHTVDKIDKQYPVFLVTAKKS